MKNKDFSVPRRMSKSAFVVFFFKELWSYSGVFLIMVYFDLKDAAGSTFLELLRNFFLMLSGMLLVVGLIAFLGYYFKTYYVSGGNLIFKHGVLRREITTLPLSKIHSMRTKRGFIYRLLDMTGVSFDTLASQSAEIELILDDDDWKALLRRVETQETETVAEPAQNDVLPPIPSVVSTSMTYSNVNLLKGAFCQNHFKGMAILGGVVATLYGKVAAIDEEVLGYAIDYVAEEIDHAAYISYSFTMIAVLVVGAYLMTMLLWMGKAFLDYFNTVLRMDDTRLFFEHGLITRRSAQFSFDKVCTIIVKQNFLEKWLNGRTIQLKQAFNISGEDEKDKEANNVKIYGVPSSANLLQWWLGKDYAASATLRVAHSGKGVFGYTVMWDIVAVAVAIIILVHFEQFIWLVIPVAYLLSSLVKGCLAVRKSRITLKNDYMEISNGKYANILNYIKYENVESVELVRSPFTPLFHRVKLRIYTNGSSYTVRSLKMDEAKEIYELLLHWCRNHN